LEEAARSARDVLRLLIDSAKRHRELIPPPERRYEVRRIAEPPDRAVGSARLESDG